MSDRARYDGTTGEPAGIPKTPGNFDQGQLQGYFGNLFDLRARADADAEYATQAAEKWRKMAEKWRKMAVDNGDRLGAATNEIRYLKGRLAELDDVVERQRKSIQSLNRHVDSLMDEIEELEAEVE